MAKYATAEEQLHCEICDRWITQREMVGVKIAPSNAFVGYACPGCEDTLWTLDIVPAIATYGFRKTIILSN